MKLWLLQRVRETCQTSLDRLEADGLITGGDAPEFESGRARCVHAELSGAGAFIPGFEHQLADRRVPIAIRIAEVPNRQTEAVLELFSAGGDFLPRGFAADPREKRVRQGMRANGVPG